MALGRLWKVTASRPSQADSFVFCVCGKRLVCDSTQPVYQRIRMGKGRVERRVNEESLLGEAARKSCPLSSPLCLSSCDINNLIENY